MTPLMRFERPWQRWRVPLALLAVSVCLHAVLLGGLAGRGPLSPDVSLRLEQRVTAVSLIAPPPARAPVATPDQAPRPADMAARVKPVAQRPPVRPVSDDLSSASKPALINSLPVPVSEVHGATTPAFIESAQTEAVAPASDALAAPGELAEPQSVAGTAQQPTPTSEAASADRPQPPVAHAQAAATDLAVALPPLAGSHARRFKVYWGDYEGRQSVARIRYELTVEGDRYEVRTEGEAEGLISLVYAGTLTQVSSGRMGPGGLIPLRYAEGRGKRAVRAVAFDPEASQLLPEGGAPIAVPRGIQDRLSVFYQLGLMARAQPAAFAPGQEVIVPVASLREMRSERFTVVGDEVLMVPGSSLRALHLHRPPPAGSRDPKIDLWLGYDQQMLPVRLRIEDRSQRVLDQLVEAAE